MSSKNSSFVPIDWEKTEGGVSICNEEITSDEEKGGTADEESYDE